MEAAEYQRIVARARKLADDKDWAEAAQLWTQVVEANPYDGRGWDRLAEARLNGGDHAGALAAYEQVRRFGVYDGDRDVTFQGVAACLIAACHAALGNSDAAFAALAEAMAEGFVHLDELRKGERFTKLRDDPRFAQVLGLEDVTGLSRDDGWRADLRLIVREAKRRRPVPFEPAMSDAFDREAAKLDGDISELNDAEIAVRLTKLLALLGDGHAYLGVESNESLSLALPVHFYLFEEGAFVTTAAEEYQSLLGQRVVAIDGRPVDELRRAVDPLICRDNERRSIEVAPGWLRKTPFLHALGLVDDPRKVTLTTTEQEVELAAVAESSKRWAHFPRSDVMVQFHDRQATLPLYLRRPDAPYWFEVLPEQRMVYLQFNAVADAPEEPLVAFADRLTDVLENGEVERVVVDLRWNGGGNTFLVAPLLKRIAGNRRLDHPGGLFLVIGRRTFSAAGNTAKFLEWLAGPNLTIVGEPTGWSPRSIGETVPFELPYSGLGCNISNLYWQGVTPLDRRSWIAPDLYAPPTFAAYLDGRDPAMDAILATI